MLENCKPEELIKYSKGSYDKEKFIERFSELWIPKGKQQKMMWLTADLAENSEGVFSVSNKSFREMYERRFKESVARITVQRFFQKLEKLKLLTINEAQRRNGEQSANIFIVEPLETEKNENDTPSEPPYDTSIVTPTDTHNKVFNLGFNKGSNTSQINNVLSIVNYQATGKTLDKNQFKTIMSDACDEFYTKFAPARYTKKSWFTLTNKFIQETVDSGRYKNIPFHKIKGYVYKSLEKMADHTDYKNTEEYAEYQEVMRILHGHEVVQ